MSTNAGEIRRRAKRKRMPQEGSQPFQRSVAKEIGARCPVGAEIQLILGLDKLWPNLPREEAFNSLLDGLASRFEAKEGGRR